MLTQVCSSRTTVRSKKKKIPWPWWELVGAMWNSQEGRTLWMSSVLEPHKVTCVLSNLVPMVTNALSSSSNVKIVSKQVHYVRSTNTASWNCNNLKNPKQQPYNCHKLFLTLTEQTVTADTWMMKHSVWSELWTKSTVTQRVSLPVLFWERLLMTGVCVLGT